MGKWGFVFLAYGIVWLAIVGYFFCLKSRMRKAESRLAQLKSPRGAGKNAS
jgi:CcmD family protein